MCSSVRMTVVHYSAAPPVDSHRQQHTSWKGGYMRQRPDEVLLQRKFEDALEGRSLNRLRDKTLAEVRESAYRRGYQQGFEEALAALEDGISAKELERLRRLISDWRYRRGQYRQARAGVRRPPEQMGGVISP
jgi:hypothetical protein